MDGLQDVLHNGDLTALQNLLFSCQEIIADAGGYVSQFTVDVRGCVLVAIWGAPIATFTDNTQRALGAAVRLRYRLMKEKMPCSIAVTSGLAYCGCLGHDIRQEYMVVGDPVDVASRIVSRIKNDIVLDAKTHTSIGSRLAERLVLDPHFRPILSQHTSTHPLHLPSRHPINTPQTTLLTHPLNSPLRSSIYFLNASFSYTWSPPIHFNRCRPCLWGLTLSLTLTDAAHACGA